MNTKIKSILSPKDRAEAMSNLRKYLNVQKHVRIANATTGHEANVHAKKAQKFATRYGIGLTLTKSFG